MAVKKIPPRSQPQALVSSLHGSGYKCSTALLWGDHSQQQKTKDNSTLLDAGFSKDPSMPMQIAYLQTRQDMKKTKQDETMCKSSSTQSQGAGQDTTAMRQKGVASPPACLATYLSFAQKGVLETRPVLSLFQPRGAAHVLAHAI